MISTSAVTPLMASKDTVTMLSALADERRIRIFEILADSDRSDSKLAEMLSADVNEIREQAAILEKAGLVIACENDDSYDYCLDPQQVAVLTGFFELVLNRCSPPKCC